MAELIYFDMPPCFKCGTQMGYDTEDKELICPDCGLRIDAPEYDPEYDEYDDYFEDPESPPRGCMACGGPYPLCKGGCPIFD